MVDKLKDYIAQRDKILTNVRLILINNLHVRRKPDEIDPDTPLFGSGLGLDSVDAVELLVSLESELGIIIPSDSEGRSSMRTLNTLVDLVMSQRGYSHGS